MKSNQLDLAYDTWSQIQEEKDAGKRQHICSAARECGALQSLATALIQKGREGDAENVTQSLLGTNSDSPTALMTLARLRTKQKNFHEAESLYSRVVSSDERIRKALVSRAHVKRKLGHAKDAVADLQAAKSIGFNGGDLGYELALSYRALGEIDNAAKEVSWLIQDFPDHALNLRTAIFVAEVLWKAGEVDTAKAHLEKATARAKKTGQKIPDKASAVLSEIQRSSTAASNHTVASKHYYDSIYENSDEYAKDPDQSVYISVWRKVEEVVSSRSLNKIVDVGCGPGQFAAFICREIPTVSYLGVDFSETAIRQAREACPQAAFEVLDVTHDSNFGQYENDVFVILEVLEHITDDLSLIKSLPVGKQVIFSVPNFDSFGHVRFFAGEKEVESRYGKYFRDLKVTAVRLGSGAEIFVSYGVRADL